MNTQKTAAPEFVDQSYAPANATTPAPSPFDNLDALRINQNFAEQAVATKVLATVPIGRPNKQAFVRVRPEPEYGMDLACLELKEDREIFIVAPAFALQIPEERVGSAISDRTMSGISA